MIPGASVYNLGLYVAPLIIIRSSSTNLFGNNYIKYKLHLLNKKTSVSSDILVGHVTSSQNESGLSKYLMVH